MAEERWEWQACYSDGTSLCQYNGNGSENKYGEIDRSKLAKFILWHGERPIFVQHLSDDSNLVYRRRVYVPLSGDPVTIHLIGWTRNLSGVSVQSISAIFPDEHIEAVPRWMDGVFDPVIPHPHEGETP